MDHDGLEHRIVLGFISAPAAEAEKLAEQMVKEKLVACAQIIAGMKSVYWWDGTVQTDDEVLIIIKTKALLQQEVADFISREHSYEVPECVFSPASGGILKYLQWVGDVTK